MSQTGQSGPLPESVAQALRARLQIPEGQSIDPARAAELLVPLLELAISMDQLVWRTWSQRVAPDSQVKRRELLQKAAAAHVTGQELDQEKSLAQFTQDAERLRQLTLCLLSAIGQTGTLFAQRWMDKYSTESIERAAQSEKKLIEAFGATCWRKFGELTAGMEKSTIDAEVNQGIAEFVEQVMKAGR